MKLREWNARLHGLVVFRSLLDDPVVAKLLDLTDRMEAGAPGYGPVCDAVAQFEAALFEHTTNWGSYLSAAVLEAETVCVRQAASGTLAPALQTALDSELAFLQALCGLTLDELLAAAGSATGQAQELAFLPRWETSGIDLPAAYAQRMSEVGKKGYGMFAKHHVFTVENGHLVPVKYPDPQRLSELPGYEKEREKVIANTRALLAGMPANNVLLYGDAGTGKSSAVKAIANEFAPDGLRLVAVILGAPSSKDRFEAAAALLDYGFGGWQAAPLPAPEVQPLQLKVKGSAEDSVPLDYSALPQTVLLPREGTAALTAQACLPQQLEAPVEKGQTVGTVQVYHGETLLGEYEVKAAADAPRMDFGTAFSLLWGSLTG